MTVSDVAFPDSWAADAGGPSAVAAARRAKAFEAARRHSRLVRRMRVLLPVAGAAALAGFIVAARLSLPVDLDLSMAGLSVTRNSIIMNNPHLTGFDSNQRRYEVSAERAIQAISAPDEVRLEAIRAIIQTEGRGAATVTAQTGDYDNSAGTLKLVGAIAVDSRDGYTLRLRDADIDLKGGTMSSSNPVTVTYQDSRTTGDRLSVSEGGKVVVLERSVRTTLMPPKRVAAEAASAAVNPKE